MPDNIMKRVLFLCTGNSCRSQMAEGWARQLLSDVIEPFSAGVEKHGLDPMAVEVMNEAGVDISGHKSKLISDLADLDFDYVITLCDNARQTCPFFPGTAKNIHIGFDDPRSMTSPNTSREEKLKTYRRVRDEIKKMVDDLPKTLGL
jgi:arsenate reductase (thioredoxin)